MNKTRTTKSTVTGRIRNTERLRNSVNGNPNYRVAIETEHGDFLIYRTSSDSSVVYDINNLEHSAELAVFGITPAGRIDTAKRVTA